MRFHNIYDLLENKFDFAEFQQKATEYGYAHNYEEKIFYQQAGLMTGLVFKNKYSSEEAWAETTKPKPAVGALGNGSSCCGGGTVR